MEKTRATFSTFISVKLLFKRKNKVKKVEKNFSAYS